MQRVLCIGLTALVLPCAFGAEERKERAKLPPELEQVSGIAMAAPPEFAANALLRLNMRVKDKDLHRELIEMAFRFASQSRNPVRLMSFPGSEADTRSGLLGNALSQRLDALSLQSRAVLDMVAIDSARARELFGEIKPPAPGRATCEESLLPDVAPYYQALTAVARSSFSQKEQANSEHLVFARTALSRVSSIAELASAAQVIASLDWPRDQFEIALGTFTSSFDRIPLDNRSFLYFSKSIESCISQLVARARQLGASPDAMVNKYRIFLVAQLRATRCADGGKIAAQILQIGQAAELFGPSIRGGRPALAAQDMQPEHVEGEMKLHSYWQTGEAQRIYVAAMKLRQGSGGTTLSPEERKSPEWTTQLTDFLGTLANWRSGGDDTEPDYYHQKAIVYEALLELVPPGALSDKVIADFVGFLKNSNLQQDNTVEWFWHARSTVDRVRANHPEQAAKILAAYKASGNVVLVLEAMLDQVAPERLSF